MALPGQTERLASCLLGYVASAENGIARVSKSHPVFAGLGLQRNIIAFAACGERHLVVVAAPEGSGKSCLLAAAERQVRAAFPQLAVHASFRSAGAQGPQRAVALLRELHRAHGPGSEEEVEGLTPGELLHNGPCLLRRISAQSAGLVLLVDDILEVCGGELPCWLPMPLPPGLHCVGTVSENKIAGIRERLGIEDASAVTIRRFGWLPTVLQQVLMREITPDSEAIALGSTVTVRVCQLLGHLVSLQREGWRAHLRTATLRLQGEAGCRVVLHILADEVEGLPFDMQNEQPWDVQGALALAILQECERRHGPAAQQTFGFLARATHGLSLEELAELQRRDAAAGGPARAEQAAAAEGAAPAPEAEMLLQMLELGRPLLHEEPWSRSAAAGGPPPPGGTRGSRVRGEARGGGAPRRRRGRDSEALHLGGRLCAARVQRLL